MRVLVDVTLLRSERVELGPQDLAEGLRRGVVTPQTVVQVATTACDEGSSDPVRLELACLLHDEMGSVPRRLARQWLKTLEPVGDNDSTSRKWVYLEMK